MNDRHRGSLGTDLLMDVLPETKMARRQGEPFCTANTSVAGSGN
jgi:hypothetical protein